MFPHALFALLVLAAPAPSADSSGRYGMPPPSVLEQLRRQHHPHDWLRVTTDAGRLEVRAQEFGASGLSGLSTRRKAPPVPAEIPWSSIARVDKRESNFRRGQITGFFVGGLLGMGTGAWLGSQISGGDVVEGCPSCGSYGDRASEGALVGTVVGAVVGTWLWGRAGDRTVHEVPLYVAPAPAAPAAEPAPGHVAATEAPDAAPSVASSDSAVATTPAAAPTREVQRAVDRLRPEQVMRLHGDFGVYLGYAAVVSSEGLEGLRPEPSGGAMPELPPMVPWSRVHSIERRGHSAGRGALLMGTTLALTGGMLGFIGAQIVDGEESALTAALGAGAVSGAFGAALGGLVGALIPRWHYVYGGP